MNRAERAARMTNSCRYPGTAIFIESVRCVNCSKECKAKRSGKVVYPENGYLAAVNSLPMAEREHLRGCVDWIDEYVLFE